MGVSKPIELSDTASMKITFIAFRAFSGIGRTFCPDQEINGSFLHAFTLF